MSRCTRRVTSALAAVFAIALLLPAPALAQGSPVGCDANLFTVTLQRSPGVAVAGETVNYTVNVQNFTVSGVQTGCDMKDVTFSFYCPGPTGALAGPFGPATNIATNADYPADGTLHEYGPFACTMPAPADGFAWAKIDGLGYLQDGSPAPGAPAQIFKTISVQVQSCLVKVDKQVSCDAGVTWFDDNGLVFLPSDDGVPVPCTAVDGTPIQVRYRVSNAGATSLYSCSLGETNPDFGTEPGVLTPLAAGSTTDYLYPTDNTAVCSDDFDAFEPNTADVSCFCTAALNPDLKVSASDTADVTCNSTPTLSVTKLCEDENTDGENEITIEVCATAADLGLVNCTVTDNIYLTDPACPADIGDPTSVTVSPANFDLAAGACQTVTGVVTVQDEACNTVSVTCTIENTETELTETADDVCEAPGEGCLTRTPGFWGTHPAITDLFLPQSVCGVALSEVDNSPVSAIEAMCSVGYDSKILGPNLTQLVRQCTAAYLNVAATQAGGGNCGSEFPNLVNLLDQCCDVDSACTGIEDDYSITECIGMVDSFNNSFDSLDPWGPFVQPGPAKPKTCQDSKKNGIVVTPTP